MEEEQSLPSFVRPGEPVSLLHEGKLAIISRSYDPSSYDKKSDTSVYAQLWSEKGWHPLKSKHSSIRVAGKRGRQDTLDIDCNPVTKRIEAVVPARAGSGDGRPHPGKMSVNIWSIDPGDLFSGSSDWRFDCALFARREPYGRIDGLQIAPTASSLKGGQTVYTTHRSVGYLPRDVGSLRV